MSHGDGLNCYRNAVMRSQKSEYLSITIFNMQGKLDWKKKSEEKSEHVKRWIQLSIAIHGLVWTTFLIKL